MAETKFTKGPWHFEGPDQFGDYNIHEPPVRAVVAAVISNLRESEEIAANARLVAAAPELYEALIEMRRVFRPFTSRPIGAPGSQARLDQEEKKAAFLQAGCALLKATGAA
jgi:hypothetical protein